MISAELKDSFLSLVRLGIGHRAYSPVKSVDWHALKALAEEHGLSAVALDGLDRVNGISIPVAMKLEWIGEVLQNYEQRYEQYKHTIAEMAAFYEEYHYKMMVLKGYACSLDWPKPNHRPCGDIDIWQFGQQKEADVLLESVEFRVESLESVESLKISKLKSSRIEIDNSHHHHTVFYWGDFMVENHYDFLNVHHHKSNVEIEAVLKELGQDDSHSVELSFDKQLESGEKEEVKSTVYLPSPNLHALFLLRHSMSNFASTGFQLRQLVDWGFFVEKHGNEVDWAWLDGILIRYGMKQLFQIFNAICVEDLGFDAAIFPPIQFLPSLKERVLYDILSPEFSEVEKGGIVRRAFLKYRRWRANAWKHELCFNESMSSAFWSGVKSHLLKPSSI